MVCQEMAKTRPLGGVKTDQELELSCCECAGDGLCRCTQDRIHACGKDIASIDLEIMTFCPTVGPDRASPVV